jgi:hypothetical protein
LEGAAQEASNLPAEARATLPVPSPALREQWQEVGALSKEDPAKPRISKKKESSVKPHGMPPRESLPDEVVRMLETLSPAEQKLVGKLGEKLRDDERESLLLLREALRYSMDLKYALSDAGKVEQAHKDLILNTVVPRLRMPSSPSLPPLQASIRLVQKWKELRRDWAASFGSEDRARVVLKDCISTLSAQLSPLSLQAARALLNVEGN